jgi:hypothetical protein
MTPLELRGRSRSIVTRPNVFLVGAPKCGTTSLTRYLAPHPDVFISTPRESFHFCTDLDIHPGLRISDRSAYLRLFEGAGDARAVIDASVWYLYSSAAARHIHDFAPDAKIIIMLRQPVDMMWSLHGWFLYTAAENILDFSEALDAQDDRRAGRRLPSDPVAPQALLYTDVVTYSRQVQRYFDRFDRDQVKVILFDDLISNTPAVFSEVLEFLQIDPTFQPDFTVHGAAREIRNPSIKQLLRRQRWLRQSVARVLPTKVRGRIGRSLARLRPPAAQRAQAMDLDLRRRLSEQFRPEIQRLAQLIDRDLSHWCALRAQRPDHPADACEP